MEAFKQHESICHAMSDPGFYPHPVSRLQRIDTHISTVFLTGQWVYKLKKPVDFGFLNFTDPDSRLYFCEREVRLNQRLSHGVYVGVVLICRDHTGRLSLDGEGQAVEYAVKMRQLSEEKSLKAILSKRPSVDSNLFAPQHPTSTLRPETLDTHHSVLGKKYSAGMEELGKLLADFYKHSARTPEIDHFGRPEVIAFNMEENFRQVEPFVDDFVPAEQWEFIREVSRAFFHNWLGLFERRVPAGRICDGHGDLRSEHIYFEDGIQIIDCIEFNDRFRYGDVIADLAFLHMDMEQLGYSELSRAVLASYVDCADDPELYTLLDFYAAYRAIVKVKVACLRSTEVQSAEVKEKLRQEAGCYLEHAYRYAVQFSRPTLWVFCGLPASGKSLLAGRLSKALSLSLFQSDRIRKEGDPFSLSHETVVPYSKGIYSTELRHRVYARMLALAQEQLKNGHSAVLDASFSRRRWRDEAARLASDLDTNLVFVECVSREEALRARLMEREKTLSISDARLQHLPKMMQDFEALNEVSPETHLRLDTDQTIHKAFIELLSEGYARKGAQVRKVL